MIFFHNEAFFQIAEALKAENTNFSKFSDYFLNILNKFPAEGLLRFISFMSLIFSSQNGPRAWRWKILNHIHFIQRHCSTNTNNFYETLILKIEFF